MQKETTSGWEESTEGQGRQNVEGGIREKKG